VGEIIDSSVMHLQASFCKTAIDSKGKHLAFSAPKSNNDESIQLF
jgi:hypothetical protein